MDETRADLILHPIRMRIIQAFLSGGQSRWLTAHDLGQLLTDVPKATLYRHLNRLAEAGLLTVVEERRVRGAVERVYQIADVSGLVLGPDDLTHATPSDHLRYFTTWIMGLLGDAARYLRQEQIDPAADGFGYRQIPLYLSDDEMLGLSQALFEAVQPYLDNDAAPGRRRRTLTTVLIPDPIEDGESE